MTLEEINAEIVETRKLKMNSIFIIIDRNKLILIILKKTEILIQII